MCIYIYSHGEIWIYFAKQDVNFKLKAGDILKLAVESNLNCIKDIFDVYGPPAIRNGMAGKDAIDANANSNSSNVVNGK